MMDIVTSLCVDDARHPASYYDQLQDVTANQRRRVYWQCAMVFFATSTRCNPTAGHVLYTNDKGPTVWHGTDYREFLRGLGVRIQEMEFEQYQPPANFSGKFRNGFYKLEVMSALSGPQAADCSLLLDSDCVWTRNSAELEAAVGSGSLLLYDMSSGPDDKIFGLSRRDMGDLYRQLFPDFPETAPYYYGGELVGGTRGCFRELIATIAQQWNHIISTYKQQPPRFCNQESIFDNDEYITIPAYNSLPRPKLNAQPFIRRMWTAYRYSDVRDSDLDLPIWHMPSEKLQGIPVLDKLVVTPGSSFWRVPQPELAHYLGRYLGVPHSLLNPQRLLSLASKLPTAWRLAKRLLTPKKDLVLTPS
ncbi:hypothetical protein [Hymenobacter tenuis]